MGYAIPGAIGAALAGPGRTIVGLTTDGSLAMSCGELETACRLALPIIYASFVRRNPIDAFVPTIRSFFLGFGEILALLLRLLPYFIVVFVPHKYLYERKSTVPSFFTFVGAHDTGRPQRAKSRRR